MTDAKHLKVEISAENRPQADVIINALLSRNLVTGGQIIEAPARFLWKSKIVDMNYCIVTSFTLRKHKEAILGVVKKVSIEEVPMVVFLPFDGNQELLHWIEETLS